METQKRIGFLDVARGIGIVCVLMGHNLWSQSRASAIIFNFHMPLFYYLSGVLFSPGKYGNGRAIFCKTAEMLIHFLFFSTLACIAFLATPELLARLSKHTLFLFLIHGEPWYDKPCGFSFHSRLFSSCLPMWRDFCSRLRFLGAAYSFFCASCFHAPSQTPRFGFGLFGVQP